MKNRQKPFFLATFIEICSCFGENYVHSAVTSFFVHFHKLIWRPPGPLCPPSTMCKNTVGLPQAQDHFLNAIFICSQEVLWGLGLLYLWLLQDLFFSLKSLFSVNPGSPRVVDRRPCWPIVCAALGALTGTDCPPLTASHPPARRGESGVTTHLRTTSLPDCLRPPWIIYASKCLSHATEMKKRSSHKLHHLIVSEFGLNSMELKWGSVQNQRHPKIISFRVSPVFMTYEKGGPFLWCSFLMAILKPCKGILIHISPLLRPSGCVH